MSDSYKLLKLDSVILIATSLCIGIAFFPLVSHLYLALSFYALALNPLVGITHLAVQLSMQSLLTLIYPAGGSGGWQQFIQLTMANLAGVICLIYIFIVALNYIDADEREDVRARRLGAKYVPVQLASTLSPSVCLATMIYMDYNPVISSFPLWYSEPKYNVGQMTILTLLIAQVFALIHRWIIIKRLNRANSDDIYLDG